MREGPSGNPFLFQRHSSLPLTPAFDHRLDKALSQWKSPNPLLGGC